MPAVEPTSAEVLLQFFSVMDGFLALGLAVWVISLGITRMDRLQSTYQQGMENMQEKHHKLTETVLNQQQANNDELMKLVSTLCLSTELPPRLAPK